MPASALVLPEHRILTPFHLLAVLARGIPMAQCVARICGGYWLRSVDELQAELDAQAARLTQLRADGEQSLSRSGSTGSGGPYVGGA